MQKLGLTKEATPIWIYSINTIVFIFEKFSIFFKSSFKLLGIICKPQNSMNNSLNHRGSRFKYRDCQLTVPPETMEPFAAILPRSNCGFDLQFHLGKAASDRIKNLGFTSVISG